MAIFLSCNGGSFNWNSLKHHTFRLTYSFIVFSTIVIFFQTTKCLKIYTYLFPSSQFPFHFKMVFCAQDDLVHISYFPSHITNFFCTIFYVVHTTCIYSAHMIYFVFSLVYISCCFEIIYRSHEIIAFFYFVLILIWEQTLDSSDIFIFYRNYVIIFQSLTLSWLFYVPN